MKLYTVVQILTVILLASCAVKNPIKPINDATENFDWSKVSKYGGTKLGIDPDVGHWHITQKFTAQINGKFLDSKMEGQKWPCLTGPDGSTSGNFAIAAEQADGKFIVGTWEWDKCEHATHKTLANFSGPNSVFNSGLNLHKGQTVYLFMTGLARAAQRNVKERSNLVKISWPFNPSDKL